jgi:hypothetical protein
VRASHRDYLRFFHQEVLGAVQTGSEQLERPEFLELFEDVLDVPEATLGDLQVLVEVFALEEGLGFGE